VFRQNNTGVHLFRRTRATMTARYRDHLKITCPFWLIYEETTMVTLAKSGDYLIWFTLDYIPLEDEKSWFMRSAKQYYPQKRVWKKSGYIEAS